MRILTQLQLVGVGVNFVFPLEGRKKNPHLAFSKRNDPTRLIFGDYLVGGCLEGVWKLSEGCLAGVWQVSFGSLEGVLRVSGRCLKGVWRESLGCLNGILVSQDW